jgi:histidinol phosphatase-like PHP family hydrolase
MLHDFHTHTFHSDGELSPIELIHRAFEKGYNTIGITDHLGIGSLRRVVQEVSTDCALARKYWNIMAIPGVELTHLPAESIHEVAQQAKESGALLVVVHGATTTEPVPRGTNMAAVQSRYVDILAHPGEITAEEAALAAKNNIFIELSGRRGHSSTNTHVASICQKMGARLLVNSDAHNEDDLLTTDLARQILHAAGVRESSIEQILDKNPLLLLERLNGHAA